MVIHQTRFSHCSCSPKLRQLFFVALLGSSLGYWRVEEVIQGDALRRRQHMDGNSIAPSTVRELVEDL